MQCKLAAVHTYLEGTPGQLVFSKVDMASREATCQRIQAETGAIFIPPYNHPHIMAGQVCYHQAWRPKAAGMGSEPSETDP